jgi:hydrogenase maturation protein HypF
VRYVKIEIKGIVQGVGFRPFVYRLANQSGIVGKVVNDPLGVDIEAAGEGDQIYLFLRALKDEAPPQAVIEDIAVSAIPPFEARTFEIGPSSWDGRKSVLISPDLATCDDCVRELFDPRDRRYRYPFINCTNCGPRFTIIGDTPYDRPFTSMAAFRMCGPCEKEYRDPSDRRFHAQPNACPECGPRLWLSDEAGREAPGDAIESAAMLLKEGKIVALKGLGGFHLACDATSDDAVTRLRERKRRYGKPFAVMARGIEDAAKYCVVGAEEEELLLSPRSPIVLLEEREDSPLSGRVAGALRHQGLFLPYTPVHHLLMSEIDFPLVMTSGNVSSEPIVTANEEALEKLSGIADGFLLHDRDILVRYDDSVTRVFLGGEYPVRRARGYAPYPVKVKRGPEVEVLALGAELKNTFCLLRGDQAFIGQHIGDMETVEEKVHFEEALDAIKRLFSLEPEVVAHDLHPDYMTTHMAADIALPRIGVQHHHAHIVSCLADNRATGRVIGVAWDGTGYGDDGTVWGGEFLLADERGYERLAHLYCYPMPGADACIYKLYRMVTGIFTEVFGGEDQALAATRHLVDIDDREAELLLLQLRSGFNAPMTSSAGRMFDAAACIAGLRSEALYDGQAACEFEAAARPSTARYGFTLDTSVEPWVVDTRPVFTDLLSEAIRGVEPGVIAGRFHATMADIIVGTCAELSRATGVDTVALSGGVFQNLILTSGVVEGLRAEGLSPLLHRRVPCNDGGVSLGQAVAAAYMHEK